MSERECVVCRGSGNVAMDVALYRANVQACSGTLDPRGDETDCPVVLAQRGLRTYDPTTCVAISRTSLKTLDSMAWARYAYRPDEHPDADDALEESTEVLDAQAQELLEGGGDG